MVTRSKNPPPRTVDGDALRTTLTITFTAREAKALRYWGNYSRSISDVVRSLLDHRELAKLVRQYEQKQQTWSSEN